MDAPVQDKDTLLHSRTVKPRYCQGIGRIFGPRYSEVRLVFTGISTLIVRIKPISYPHVASSPECLSSLSGLMPRPLLSKQTPGRVSLVLPD